jgi:hypothetical protein
VVEWGKSGDGIESPVPVAKGGLSGVKALEAGEEFSLALLENGTVLAWGSNGSGRLGNGTETASEAPVAVCAVGETAPCAKVLEGVKAIAAGQNWGLAVLENGTAVTWGSNSSGRLGNGTETSSSVPVVVCAVGALAPCTEESKQLKEVTAVGGSENHSMALLKNGTVGDWGANGQGQLGNGTEVSSTTPVAVCAVGETAGCTKHLSGVTAIADGGESGASYALLESGNVVDWGEGGEHELGDGRAEKSSTPVLVCAVGEKEKEKTETAPCANNLQAIKGIAAGDEQGFAIGPPPPTVTAVSPNEGTSAGGTSVSISGSAFEEVKSVKFGSVNAESFTVNSEGSITAKAPRGTGTVDVTVTTPAGTSTSGVADHYTFVPGLPELGRCVAEPKGKGAYTRAECVAQSKTHTGAYEWVPGAGASKAVKEVISGPVLQGVKGTKIGCTDAQLTGEYTGAKSEKFTKLVIQGCENVTHHTQCYTNPLAPGTIESEVPLVGELGFIPGSKIDPYVGWDLKAEKPATPIVTFSCGEAKGLITMMLEGSVIARVQKTNVMVAGFGELYKQTAGKQAPSAFLGGPEEVLSLVEKAFGSSETITQQAGLAGGATITDGESLEIKAKV